MPWMRSTMASQRRTWPVAAGEGTQGQPEGGHPTSSASQVGRSYSSAKTRETNNPPEKTGLEEPSRPSGAPRGPRVSTDVQEVRAFQTLSLPILYFSTASASV